MSVISPYQQKSKRHSANNENHSRIQRKVRVPTERGVKLIHNPVYNKGTGFTGHERALLGLRGLLPPRALTQDEQADRIMANFYKKTNDLEKYVYMVALQDRNENLFYYVVRRHLEELMPIIYTPTVGQACQSFGHIYRRSRGLYLTKNDRGHIREVLMNWPHKEVKVIVLTDGGRILGLGDLGINGMGIPIGKLALYTACAGLDPTTCLPITFDVGTNNEELLDDPFYLGHKERRISGEDYIQLFDEFINSVQELFPGAIIQFEDFATANAFTLLHRYRDKARVFNDDIQGTASVALAGLLAALRVTGQKLSDQKILFFGAGEAGIGIGDMISMAMQEEGLTIGEARKKNWFMDSKALVCSDRNDLAPHKVRYAHDHRVISDIRDIIQELRPTAIIGVSGQKGIFDKDVISLMSEVNERPIIFALSNPTSKAECTAEEAYTISQGKAIFASGSPFAPVHYKGEELIPGQGNNVYIFPGIGLGLAYCHPKVVTERMFYQAAKVVASEVTDEELAHGTVYPSFKRIKEVSHKIAMAVVKVAVEDDLVPEHFLVDLAEGIKKSMYTPDYAEYL